MEEKTFYEHIDELRWRIIKSLIALALLSSIAYFFKAQIFNILIRPLNQSLVFLSPAEAFLTFFKLSIFTGLIIAFPYILYQTWAFLIEVFEERKKKGILGYIIASIVLFYSAIVFCYYIILPVTLKFFSNFGNEFLLPSISFQNYFNFVMYMLLAFGLVFQFPVILLGLINLGILSVDNLKNKRRYVIVIVFILAAILTPTPDGFTQTALALPVILLFEITLLVARLINRKAY